MRVLGRGEGVLEYLALFTSVSTLVCCALPSQFVLIVLGATIASVVSAAPWLIDLSRHKSWMFSPVGVLIAANFVYVFLAPPFRTESEACPVDGPSACEMASRVSHRILWASAAIYLIGLISAYLLGPLLRHLG